MMVKTTTLLQRVINDSIECYQGMVVSVKYWRDVVPNFKGLDELEKAYWVNNETISYVLKGVMYVTPYTQRREEILQKYKFRKNFMMVPFSRDNEFPKNESSRWKALREEQNSLLDEEFRVRCLHLSQQVGIKPIDEMVLNRCLRIPRNGVQTFSPGSGTRKEYYPRLTRNSRVPEDYLGRFATKGNVVVFIYRDGSTMVTRGRWILPILQGNGYRAKDMEVPFQAGEVIQDYEPAFKWARIQKMPQPSTVQL